LYYLIYNAIFLGIPAYDYYVFGIPPYGQFSQNLGRASEARLNIDSLLTNLQVMNWFVFPFISWVILGMGIFYQYKKYFNLFLITFPYALIWCFYIVLNTGHHFLAYFCWLAPFSFAFIDQLMQRWPRKIPAIVWVSFLSLVMVWTYTIHIHIYSYDAYPRYLLPVVYGETTGWINNIYKPYRKIAKNLNEILGPNSTVISLVDGAVGLFYYPEREPSAPINFDILQGSNGQCLSLKNDTLKQYKIRAVISFVEQNICSDIVEQVIKYPGSNVQLTIIAR
jgi:hypothetical protein